jgi:NAD(P)-dependent dehydrogenase (short-subunit alcohol dehydrogenase family)
MKIAIVGANRGIGLALCQLLSPDHQVYGFCRQSSEALNSLPMQAVIEDFDVTPGKPMCDKVKSAGLPTLDYLFHVSGIMRSETLDHMNVDTIREQMDVNAIAPILSVQAFLPHLGAGSKVGLLTSRMGSIADNTSGGRYGYRMSKAALNMAGKSLAEDLRGQGIGVYLLHPGYVQTDMTEGKGLITPAQSAQGLWEVMQQRELSETGSFWHSNGEPLPW